MGDYRTAAHFKSQWEPLRDFLSEHGASLPAGAPARRIRILSPFRTEIGPSFDLYIGQTGWRWTDWGDTDPKGQPLNGTIIDLMILHGGARDATDAIGRLCRRYGDPVPADRPGVPDGDAGRRKRGFSGVLAASTETVLPPAAAETVEAGVETGFFLRYANRGIRSDIGTGYLASRGLSSRVYPHLHDCSWSPLSDSSVRFYGVGLRNLAGDWNVRAGMRNKAKSRLLVRADRDQKERGGLSVVRVGDARTWDVVEGMLSGMALVDAGFCDGALLVLNGTGNAGKAVEILAQTAAKNPDVAIRLHLDGDHKADGANGILLNAVPSARDYRPIYLAQQGGAGGDPLDYWAADRDGMRAALADRTAEIENEFRGRGIAA